MSRMMVCTLATLLFGLVGCDAGDASCARCDSTCIRVVFDALARTLQAGS